MSLHVFANIVTSYGTAANNRGDSQGSNVTPLQKLIWHGEPHTTVSAEAIRFALRRILATLEEARTNRQWNECAKPKPRNEWQDPEFTDWASDERAGFIDDDLLGFMSAQAAQQDGEEGGENQGSRRRARGTVTLRRGVLEISRAVSLTPWTGDVVFNAATPWSNLGAKNKDEPTPYNAEVHATRYQFGLALTPERLRDKSRAAKAVTAISQLGTVAGNHGRFLYDFSPDSIVLRLTQDPAPRLLYCFEPVEEGKSVDAPSLLARVKAGDIDAKEIILGGPFAATLTGKELQKLGATVPSPDGIKAAATEAVKRVNQALDIKG